MKNPIIEVKTKFGGTVLKMGLWEFVWHHIYSNVDGFTLLQGELILYLNGEGVAKPPEMEEEE